MFFSEFDSEDVRKEASKILKSWKVKHRLKTIDSKSGDKKEVLGVFKTRLEKVWHINVNLRQYDRPVGVAAFVVDSCNYLRTKIETDGLFRRPGVAMRQKQLKQFLQRGGQLIPEHDHSPTDVADLLKQFFRDLPEPCIPYVFHDILQRCLEVKEKEREATLLAVLLLPTDHLYTLAYLMQFLKEVAEHWQSNRMDVCNLAIVWTPNLMPFKTGQVNDKKVLEKRLSIIQLLIENACCIGMVPEYLYEHLPGWQPSCSLSSHDELESSRHRDKKKKRRSGSLTRMLSGIKKMVRKSGSEEQEPVDITPDNSVPHTPRIMSTGKKRKATESSSALPVFSAKKRRELLELLPQGALLPDVCSATTTHLTPRILVAQPLTRGCEMTEAEPKRKSCFYTTKTPDRPKSRSSSRLRLSHFGLGKKHKKKPLVSDDSELEVTMTPNALDTTSASEGYNTRISRSEFEDIESRVSRIESRISSEFENIVGVSMSDLEMTPDRTEVSSIHTVQSAYKKALESAGKFNSPTSDELARRFSKDLKIRGSSEKKVIRSPSARKIGSLRRRSKENIHKIKRNLSLNMPDRLGSRHHFDQINSLIRGKPNTVSNGLPDPFALSTDQSQGLLRDCTNQLRSESIECQRDSLGANLEPGEFDLTSFGVLTRSQARRASSFHGCDLRKVPTSVSSPFKHVNNSTPVDTTEWTNAEDFLNEEKTEKRSVNGRPSLAKLRSQNAGMVLAKTKLFDTLVDSNSCVQTKAFKTSKPASEKSREIKKRNSSKSSKERKLQRKNSQAGERRSRRENSVPKQTIEYSTNLPTNAGPWKENVHISNGNENFPDSKNQSVQNLLPNTSQQREKTVQKRFNNTCTPGQVKASQLNSPLKERNRYTSETSSSRASRQPVSKCAVLGRSPNVRPTSREERSSPFKTLSSTPRRSPRQILLKSRHLSRP